MQNPDLKMPSARTIRRELDLEVTEIEDSLLVDLPPNAKVAVSLDCWSNVQRASFLCILVTYITTDWVLAQKMIGMVPLNGLHSGQALATIVNERLGKYGLEKRVLAITTDNASDNGTMVGYVNQYLELVAEAFDSSMFLDGRVTQVPCIAHILQLAVKDLLGKRLTPTNETIEINWKQDKELGELEELRGLERRGMKYLLALVRSPESSINQRINYL